MEVCEEILKVYDKIDPGETSQRANVMFELNCARIIQTKAKLNDDCIKRDQAIVCWYEKSVIWNFNSFLIYQIYINECLIQVKKCFDILIAETENKFVMEQRLDKILNESFV